MEKNGLTETIPIKHIFVDKELIALSRKAARAHSVINEKQDAFKSMATTMKADIAEQEAIINSCSEKINSGYEMIQKECNLKYENGTAKYTDIETGEVLEERPMTQSEQMHLAGTGTWKDAEQVIRADNEKEDK